jgi:eukaryotic-like serine/threonine-protein kinase
MKTIRLCPGCGAPLTSDAPGGLCPQCLLQSQIPGEEEIASAAPRSVPLPGGEFGHYHILRLLGHGGMGEVFEAEHVATGRRVALKVMRHTLASDQDRKRFLREGRLAASVSHPNVVYIHGSEEIDGSPAIAMELVHGGTLKDRLKSEGPLPISDAVTAALQIIEGLEAAHAAGVLHRDIKPANCFIAADGTVKVGDFGLSVSTLARGESLITASGSVMGTPAYASPEQLRGEELDVTSDIYSVGATLYHLLTGKTPFNANDFVKLITEVLDKQPVPPKSLRAEIPAELSKILLRCLAKDRKARFQTYAEVRDALLPFRASEVVPARPGLRFLADLMDCYIAYAPSLVFLIYWSFDPLDQFSRQRTLSAGLMAAALYAWHFLYYTVSEGLWGAGLGKMICGLRVVGPDRQPPGLLRALLRTTIYTSSSLLPPLIAMIFFSAARLQAAASEEEFLVTDFLWPLIHISLFLTMRRRNGYAAVHDLLSRTRVIVRPKSQARPALAAAVVPPMAPEVPTLRRFGPYEVQATLWQHGGQELLLGFDPALRRRVWIHLRTTGSPAASAERQDLSRPGRLRWLSSGSTDQQVWEAYEAIEGASLQCAAARPQAWGAVRFWLHDLAGEMAALLERRDLTPLLDLNRVWISAKGHALLLEFPCPDLPASELERPESPRAATDETAAQHFLHSVARLALEGTTGQAAPVPMPAQAFLQSLARGGFSQARMIVGNLESLLSKPGEITRSRRAASLALVPIFLFCFAFVAAGIVGFQRFRKEKAWNAAFPGEPSLALMDRVHNMTADSLEKGTATSNNLRRVEAYFVTHYAHLITNDAVWKDPRLTATLAEIKEDRLRKMVREFEPVSPEQMAKAERDVPRRLRSQDRAQRTDTLWAIFGVVIAGFIFFALVDVIGCLVLRVNPVLRLFGIAVLDARGQPASRGRLLARAMMVWTVAGIGVAVLVVCGILGIPSLNAAIRYSGSPGFPSNMAPVSWTLLALALATLAALITYAIRNPSRGLQDRLTGTTLIPR